MTLLTLRSYTRFDHSSRESASSRSRGPPADKITSPIPVTACRTPEDFDGAV